MTSVGSEELGYKSCDVKCSRLIWTQNVQM